MSDNTDVKDEITTEELKVDESSNNTPKEPSSYDGDASLSSEEDSAEHVEEIDAMPVPEYVQEALKTITGALHAPDMEHVSMNMFAVLYGTGIQCGADHELSTMMAFHTMQNMYGYSMMTNSMFQEFISRSAKASKDESSSDSTDKDANA